MRQIAWLFPLAMACALSGATANHPADLARSVTIYRDTYGVPHIFGATDASCVFGYAYAQAEDNFWQIEDSYLRALGRASEIYGERTLTDDELVRALEIPRLAIAEYQRESPRAKELLDATADGLNYFLAQNRQVKPRLLITAFRAVVHAGVQPLCALLPVHLYGEMGVRSPRKIASRWRSYRELKHVGGPYDHRKALRGTRCCSSIRTSRFSGRGNGMRGMSIATRDGTCRELRFSGRHFRRSGTMRCWVGAIR